MTRKDANVISEIVIKASASLDAEVIQDLQEKDPEEKDLEENENRDTE